ncbi:Endomembrane protein 70 [Apiospora saccharicola]
MRGTIGATSSATLIATLLTIPQLTSAFYLPGVAPTSYKKDASVPLYVNSVKPVAASQDGVLHSVMSYDYYHERFRFCQPAEPKYVSESLGSILFGDRIMTSGFQLEMGHNQTCKSLCESVYDEESAHFVNKRIMQGYAINWLVDGLPAGQKIIDEITSTTFYSPGFQLGQVHLDSPDRKPYFNNHYDIVVEYHEVGGDPNQLRVVGVIVQPDSKAYSGAVDSKSCLSDNLPPVMLAEDGKTKVHFTYSVYWTRSPTAWATRWDKYLHVFDPKIHWFSLINSAVVVVVLTITVTSVLFRALKKDIARYNRLDQINLDDLSGTSALEDGVQEDSGWKLVHGDVFRTPSHPLLLSIFLGNGAQLFVMTGFTICFALLGFLSPSNRGSLGTIMILLYTILGFVGGYTSARVYKSLNGDKWKLNIGLTPYCTMLVIISIWFIISIPLSFAGSWLGFRAQPFEPPVRTNQIPRQIPPTTTYLKPVPSMLLVGILPFGAIFVELYFIMSSIWFSKIYYMFGFLFLCYGLMIITCAAVTVLMVYFLLCAENYNWQWRSFLAAGMSAGYIFANALIYLVSKLALGSWSGTVLYIGYSALLSFLFFILTGSIGFFSSWWFVQKIYSSIKID